METLPRGNEMASKRLLNVRKTGTCGGLFYISLYLLIFSITSSAGSTSQVGVKVEAGLLNGEKRRKSAVEVKIARSVAEVVVEIVKEKVVAGIVPHRVTDAPALVSVHVVEIETETAIAIVAPEAVIIEDEA